VLVEVNGEEVPDYEWARAMMLGKQGSLVEVTLERREPKSGTLIDRYKLQLMRGPREFLELVKENEELREKLRAGVARLGRSKEDTDLLRHQKSLVPSRLTETTACCLLPAACCLLPAACASDGGRVCSDVTSRADQTAMLQEEVAMLHEKNKKLELEGPRRAPSTPGLKPQPTEEEIEIELKARANQCARPAVALPSGLAPVTPACMLSESSRAAG
jgi:hypothetical protein